MKEGDYEGDYLGGWRGRAAGLQKPPPRARADLGLPARQEAPATSRPGWAQPRHCSERGLLCTGPSVGRRWARVSRPHWLLLPRASPWGHSRSRAEGERQARSPGLGPRGVGSPRGPCSTHPLLCWPLVLGPPTAAHPRLAWPPAGLV